MSFGSCIIQATLSFNALAQGSSHPKKREALTKRLYQEIDRLYYAGFHDFTIYIGMQTDYWVAEALWVLSKTKEKKDLTYTLIFLSTCTDAHDRWIEDQIFWKEVLSSAKEIQWQSEFYPKDNVPIRLIRL